jgi:nitroreductase/SAM-dependent methyltransferase
MTGKNREAAHKAGSTDAEAILERLAARHSCRVFDGRPMDQETIRRIVLDGTQAPSSCNQQQWHFIVVTDREALRKARDIAGGNPHFSECGALIYLTFQKGWAHRNYSVVQSVGAAGYHMLLSTHLRGYSGIWNAGVGDHSQLREMLGIPEIFEILGALAIGRAAETAPAMKAPRRPDETIMSFERFERPAPTIYPVKPAESYPADRIANHDNPFAEWNPSAWTWEQLADFRGYSVWAKSPTPGVFVSARHGEATAREMEVLGPVAPGEKVAEIMPWGGTTTVELLRHLPMDAQLNVVELSDNNLSFIRERLRREGLERSSTSFLRADRGRLPFPDGSLDIVYFPQSLEQVPDLSGVLGEAHRVLKTGGRLLAGTRNMTSRYGRDWRDVESRGQVPLQGPFTPLPARTVRSAIADRFEITDEAGIGLAQGYDADLSRGAWRQRRRIYVLKARRR